MNHACPFGQGAVIPCAQGKPLEALRPMAFPPLRVGVALSPEIMHKGQKESHSAAVGWDIVPEKGQGSLHQIRLSVSFQSTQIQVGTVVSIMILFIIALEEYRLTKSLIATFSARRLSVWTQICRAYVPYELETTRINVK